MELPKYDSSEIRIKVGNLFVLNGDNLGPSSLRFLAENDHVMDASCSYRVHPPHPVLEASVLVCSA